MVKSITNLLATSSLKPSSVKPLQNAGTPKSAAKSIASSFEKMIDAVNHDQKKAEKMVNEMVAGKNKDIPSTMIAMEKADVSLRLLMSVRNKVVAAYEEMMRMQI